MSRYKTLFGNTVIFFISEFASKLLVFLMLPLYTRYLNSNEYGNVDLISTTVTLALPIFTLSISQAVMRFTMTDNNKQSAFSFGFKITIIGFAILILLYPVLVLFIESYEVLLFYLLYITTAMYTLFSQYCRAINKVILVGTAGIVNTVSTICFNVAFLMVLDWGIKGYVLALCYSYLLASLVMFFHANLYRHINWSKLDISYGLSMLKYSIPLVTNSLGWWLSSNACRYIIVIYWGVGIQGFYAAAAKIPIILTTLESIFINAWQLSAIDEYNKRDTVEFYSEVYKLYSFFMVFLASVLMLSTKLIVKVLFAPDFYETWIYVPFLLFSVVFGALSGFLGTIFAACMKNKTMFTSALTGGIVAAAASLICVPFTGAIGASYATALSSIVIWLIRLRKSRSYVKLDIDPLRSYSSYFLLLLQAICMITFDTIIGYSGSAVVFLILVILNFSYIKRLCDSIMVYIFNKHKKNKISVINHIPE